MLGAGKLSDVPSAIPGTRDGLPVSKGFAGAAPSAPMHPYCDEAVQDRIVAASEAAIDL